MAGRRAMVSIDPRNTHGTSSCTTVHKNALPIVYTANNSITTGSSQVLPSVRTLLNATATEAGTHYDMVFLPQREWRMAYKTKHKFRLVHVPGHQPSIYRQDCREGTAYSKKPREE